MAEPTKKKSKAAIIKESAKEIYRRVMAKRTNDLYELILLAQEKKDKDFDIKKAGELYRKSAIQVADMAIVAAAQFEEVWDVKRGKYVEKESE